jgi:predicted 2-oxoglutarate/Fe(II)-dependent dioxygenase YbiX
MQKEVILENRIFLIHDFLSAAECREFIDRSEQSGYTDAPINSVFGASIRKDVRDNTRVILDDPVLAADWFQRALPYLPAQLGPWTPVGLNERFRFYRYDPGQSFKRHYDGSYRRLNREESLLTFMVYLNEDYTGGTTDFYHPDDRLKASVTPKTGMALVFEHLQLHEGAPVETGRKYVLRTDVMYKRCQ